MNRIVKSLLRRISRFLTDLKTVRRCPICVWSGRKFALGGPPYKRRYDACCPKCGSLERHRLAFLVAKKCKKLDYSKVIHVAPEKELSKWLRSVSTEYLSIDISAEAMAKMDITDLKLEDNSQTLIWASHVLEHVANDRKAIAELYRVLAPGGVAFIQVPIWRTQTFEDFAKSTPEERLEEFYQPDHVRLYGLDITDRFENVGFSSEIFRAQDFGPDALLENGLSFVSTNEVFIFQKNETN